MARTREYDEATVLTGAMNAFRRKGYRGVSIKDLESATSLKGGSIYNSFGDKAGVFTAAFERYLESVLVRRIATFAPEQAGMAGVQALLISSLNEPNGESFGCLITNAAVEFGGDSATMPRGIEAGLNLLRDTFAHRLAAAQAAGRLAPAYDPLRCAVSLLALYQGILVLVRAGYDKAVLKLMIDDEFNRMEVANEPEHSA